MQVNVLEARDLPAADAATGKSDPIVEIFTDAKRKIRTDKRSNTLNPVWDDEEHFLMVQVRPVKLCIGVFWPCAFVVERCGTTGRSSS